MTIFHARKRAWINSRVLAVTVTVGSLLIPAYVVAQSSSSARDELRRPRRRSQQLQRPLRKLPLPRTVGKCREPRTVTPPLREFGRTTGSRRRKGLSSGKERRL